MVKVRVLGRIAIRRPQFRTLHFRPTHIFVDSRLWGLNYVIVVSQ